jgi:ABC-2 type transport system ATP-binding protein
MGAAIEARALTRTYRGGRGVFELGFRVEEGEIFGFLGPNGAGKTTTIRVLMGMIRPTSGEARVFGLDVWRQSAAVKARIGFVPGDLHLYERMTGEGLLRFFASYRPPGTMERAHQLARRFELDLRQRVRHLSKGNRQKLILVQALMHDPPLLVLDEPTSGLDPLAQTDFLDLLGEERSRGKTVFLSSHLLQEVEKVADSAAIVRDGRLVAIEDVDRLRTVRERRMEVVLHRPLQGDPFSGIDGVRLLGTHEGGRRLELAVHGDPGPLLQRLATLPVADLVYPPADLESVFLHFYREAAATGGEQVPA